MMKLKQTRDLLVCAKHLFVAAIGRRSHVVLQLDGLAEREHHRRAAECSVTSNRRCSLR